MTDRRSFLSGAVLAGAGLALSACGNDSGYSTAQVALRAPLPANPQLVDFIRHATLAGNSHNTQPWLFGIIGDQIVIRPDFRRRTPAVDPDDHHLFVSLGCAAENLLVAAAANGRPGRMAYDEEDGGRITIELARGPQRIDELALAIPARQSTRSTYESRALSTEHLRAVEAAAAMDGVSLTLITDATGREKVLEQVIAGNNRQMDDPAFVAELTRWIRFNAREALATGDGLYSAASGNPSLPSWIAPSLFRLVFTKSSETRKYVSHVRASAGIAVFTGAKADKAHWVQVGRSFQRFALQATSLGIRHAHLNQPIEVPELRLEFARFLGAPDARPDLVIRFGYAPVMPMSLRRPVASVIQA